MGCCISSGEEVVISTHPAFHHFDHFFQEKNKRGAKVHHTYGAVNSHGEDLTPTNGGSKNTYGWRAHDLTSHASFSIVELKEIFPHTQHHN